MYKLRFCTSCNLYGFDLYKLQLLQILDLYKIVNLTKVLLKSNLYNTVDLYKIVNLTKVLLKSNLYNTVVQVEII